MNVAASVVPDASAHPKGAQPSRESASTGGDFTTALAFLVTSAGFGRSVAGKTAASSGKAKDVPPIACAAPKEPAAEGKPDAAHPAAHATAVPADVTGPVRATAHSAAQRPDAKGKRQALRAAGHTTTPPPDTAGPVRADGPTRQNGRPAAPTDGSRAAGGPLSATGRDTGHTAVEGVAAASLPGPAAEKGASGRGDAGAPDTPAHHSQTQTSDARPSRTARAQGQPPPATSAGADLRPGAPQTRAFGRAAQWIPDGPRADGGREEHGHARSASTAPRATQAPVAPRATQAPAANAAATAAASPAAAETAGRRPDGRRNAPHGLHTTDDPPENASRGARETGAVQRGAAEAAQVPVGSRTPGSPGAGNKAAQGNPHASGERTLRSGRKEPGAGRADLSVPSAVANGHGTAPAAQAASGPRGPASPAFPPLHEQIAWKISSFGDGDHRVEVKLSPKDLGDLRIDLRVHDGRMDARLFAANHDARALLLQSEAALREALSARGITLSSYTVALTTDGGSGERRMSRPGHDEARRKYKGSGKTVRTVGPVRAQGAIPVSRGEGTCWIA